mmetsp:Transcript_60674/g.169572  ORF Transcript_60674/g.169572 Transcript_60674/m.169572 type:complete len:869 (-) Transcript_60674:176-2782(-)
MAEGAKHECVSSEVGIYSLDAGDGTNLSGSYIFDFTTRKVIDVEILDVGKFSCDPISEDPLPTDLSAAAEAALPCISVADSEIMAEIQKQDNEGAFFVLPSQLNGVEYPSHDAVVALIEDYKDDNTGGPRGQLAVHPAVGQFLLDNAAHDGKPDGINAADGILKKTEEAGVDFTLMNGYLKMPEPNTAEDCERAFEAFSSALHTLRTLVMEAVPAVGLTPDKDTFSKATHNVNLVYASAVPLEAYVNFAASDEARALHERVAEAMTFAQYYGAMRAAARTVTEDGRCKIFLLPLGGGVFNNSFESIARSMSRAVEELTEDERAKLDIRALAWSGNPTEASSLKEFLQAHNKLAEDASASDAMTFEPPEEVKKWLSKEDWAALMAAWEKAEAEDMAWAAGEDGWGGQSSPSASPMRHGPRRRRPWKPDFQVLGQDSNRPPPLRRYFDELPSETSIPRQPVRPDVAKLFGPERSRGDIWSIQHPSFPPDISEATSRRLARSGPDCHEVLMEQRESQWVEAWQKTCSVDNDNLHPLLRHYFDRRGLETSYRTRPDVDKVTPKLRPRTPGRPSTREKLLRFSTSEPSLPKDAEPDIDAGKRGEGYISWGRRCLTHGPDAFKRVAEDGSRIPWVHDHNRTESEDNNGLNPWLRHYFGKDGIESSFRNRGRHHGRPLRGLPELRSDQTQLRRRSVGNTPIGSVGSLGSLGNLNGQGRRTVAGGFGDASASRDGRAVGSVPGSVRSPGSVSGSARAPGSVSGSARAPGSVAGSVRAPGSIAGSARGGRGQGSVASSARDAPPLGSLPGSVRGDRASASMPNSERGSLIGDPSCTLGNVRLDAAMTMGGAMQLLATSRFSAGAQQDAGLVSQLSTS